MGRADGRMFNQKGLDLRTETFRLAGEGGCAKGMVER
ncbi:hypothetical protein HNQ99_001736 [Rhizorhapis suberifaciens]|uniref:Uncharacterized protein n=1 Tax=Rhizorhapis suberifaciens TaxID=13656 RepID=A0A840HV08_9SPHN|nr:hypothetical protein [Rhizorhapis suberifaciens]